MGKWIWPEIFDAKKGKKFRGEKRKGRIFCRGKKKKEKKKTARPPNDKVRGEVHREKKKKVEMSLSGQGEGGGGGKKEWFIVRCPWQASKRREVRGGKRGGGRIEAVKFYFPMWGGGEKKKKKSRR